MVEPGLANKLNFYPRSPCGERLGTVLEVGFIYYISIHALLAESDSDTFRNTPNKLVFLSTLSLRRATFYNRPYCFPFNISIHALLAESDFRRRDQWKPIQAFLSTLSLRRATAMQIVIIIARTVISIHALLAESDSKSAQNSEALLRI